MSRNEDILGVLLSSNDLMRYVLSLREAEPLV